MYSHVQGYFKQEAESEVEWPGLRHGLGTFQIASQPAVQQHSYLVSSLIYVIRRTIMNQIGILSTGSL